MIIPRTMVSRVDAPGDAPLAALRRDALRDLLACAALLVAASLAVAVGAGLGADYAAKAIAVFLAAGVAIRQGLAAHLPRARFGAANRVTLARLAIVSLLAACLGEPVVRQVGPAWGLAAAAALAASLDAVDGPLARSRGLASDFGARFDMETDALLILVLAALLVQADRAGAWVLAAGLMRYAFVAAGLAWPWLRQPLRPSLRRKVGCVVQVASLVACLAPVVPRAASVAIAAVSLAALTLSFAVDVAWLARARHRPGEMEP